jgi:hypothetical protein
MTVDDLEQPAAPQEAVHDEEAQPPSRQERRDERRRRERQRVAKHGASLRRVYRDAVSKRAAPGRKKGRRA